MIELDKTKSRTPAKPELALNIEPIEKFEKDGRKASPKTARGRDDKPFFEEVDSRTSNDGTEVSGYSGQFKDESKMSTSVSQTKQLPTLSKAQKELLSEFEER